MSGETGGPSLTRTTKIAYRRWRGLQLRLPHLILPVLVFVLFVAVTLLITLPDPVAGAAICVTSILVLVALIVSSIYARDFTRAFCIGAIVPTFIVSIVVTYLFFELTYGMSRHGYVDPLYPLRERADGLRFAAIAGSLMAAVAGALSLVLRWCFVGRNGQDA